MNVKALYDAYKAIVEAERKQKALDQMSAEVINYGIIRDLINSAYHGVVITVTFKDGTKLDIERKDAYDRAQKSYTEAF